MAISIACVVLGVAILCVVIWSLQAEARSLEQTVTELTPNLCSELSTKDQRVGRFELKLESKLWRADYPICGTLTMERAPKQGMELVVSASQCGHSAVKRHTVPLKVEAGDGRAVAEIPSLVGPDLSYLFGAGCEGYFRFGIAIKIADGRNEDVFFDEDLILDVRQFWDVVVEPSIWNQVWERCTR